MKTITIKSIRGKSFIINPAVVSCIEVSEPNLSMDAETRVCTSNYDSFAVTIRFTGGDKIKLVTYKWESHFVINDDVEDNDIDIEQYRLFIAKLESF